MVTSRIAVLLWKMLKKDRGRSGKHLLRARFGIVLARGGKILPRPVKKRDLQYLNHSLVISAGQDPFRHVVQNVDRPVVRPLLPPGDLRNHAQENGYIQQKRKKNIPRQFGCAVDDADGDSIQATAAAANHLNRCNSVLLRPSQGKATPVRFLPLARWTGPSRP